MLFLDVITTSDEVERGASATLTCAISGLTKEVTVVFTSGGEEILTEGGVTTVDHGTYGGNAQTATLVVYNVTYDALYTCVVTSTLYPSSDSYEAEILVKMFGT